MPCNTQYINTSHHNHKSNQSQIANPNSTALANYAICLTFALITRAKWTFRARISRSAPSKQSFSQIHTSTSYARWRWRWSLIVRRRNVLDFEGTKHHHTHQATKRHMRMHCVCHDNSECWCSRCGCFQSTMSSLMDVILTCNQCILNCNNNAYVYYETINRFFAISSLFFFKCTSECCLIIELMYFPNYALTLVCLGLPVESSSGRE